MERKVLGKGLDALIPADSQGLRERVQMLKVSEVEASRFQPRLTFSEDKIRELSQSIREKGVIQPILVRPVTEGHYELIAGERRLRAVKHLGLDEIPAIVRRVSDADLIETSIIENIQREELNPLEEAKAYRRLGQEFGMTQDFIAQRIGKDKSTVSNLLRLLNLPEKIQKFLSENLITFGHAKALLSLSDQKYQIRFCERIVRRGLSVRQIEALTQKTQSQKHHKHHRSSDRDADIETLEERLRHQLGTKVRILHGRKRGRIIIEYYSLEDLDRICGLLK